MKIAIITTGDEVMSGNVVDTNAAYLSDKCWMKGHEVVWRFSVCDKTDDIASACKLAADKADVVFVTGGLGATADDITLEAAAKAFGKKMIYHDDIWRGIQSFFKEIGRECTENNKRQAYLPEGGKALKNTVGTAPGVQVKLGGAIFFFLPGVPKELYQIFGDSIDVWLEKNSTKGIYRERFLKCFGIPEASLDERLKGVDLAGCRLSFRVSFPEIKLKLVVRAASKAKADAAILKAEKNIRTRVDEFIFGSGEETLESVVGKLLANKKLKLASAESCTGGLIASKLTDVSGASAYFERGFVTYSNESKIAELGVSEAVIKKHGAVSRECAVAMAEGARKVSGADVALSVTGIAGPTGGTKEKPVGTVHMAVATKNGTAHAVYCHPRDRASFKILVAFEVLDLLRRELLKL